MNKICKIKSVNVLKLKINIHLLNLKKLNEMIEMYSNLKTINKHFAMITI